MYKFNVPLHLNEQLQERQKRCKKIIITREIDKQAEENPF